MAPLHFLTFTKVLLISSLIILFFNFAYSLQPHNDLKNQTKLSQTKLSQTKNQTKLIKPTINKNQTNPISNSPLPLKTQVKKLNSTPKSIKKTLDLPKPIIKDQTPTKKQEKDVNLKPKPKPKPSWIDQEDEDDFVSEFRDLPTRFQETLLPDLEKISKTSKVYLSKANKDFTDGFKPLVGKKYAPIIASIISCTFIIIPLILVSLFFNKIKAYFSLQKLIIFVQIYLSIYFTILCLSAVITGLEPLRFFYATSRSTYICIQVLQTLGYVLYLLLLLMYMILVFSTDTGPGTKVLGLGQTFVGFAVGLHYYMTVFHRAVLKQPPRSSWKSHAVYATCFFVICLLANAERRKKAYLEEDGEEGKKN